MFKKSLLAVCFIITAVMLSGCNSNKAKNAPAETPAPAETTAQAPAAAPAAQGNVDYVVTTVLPTASYEGCVDKANPAFAKIYPHINRSEYPEGKDKIKWFTTGLGSKIPPFKTGKLLEVINLDKDFVAFIGNVDEKMFKQYFEELADSGYLFEGPTGWDNMNLYNENYAVNLRFGQDGRAITTIRARILTPAEQTKAKAAVEKRNNEYMAAQAMKKVEDTKKEAAKLDTAKKEAAKK